MRYRQCLCGQAVEEKVSVCPYCQSEISAQPVLDGEPPNGPASASPLDRDDWYYMYEGHMVGPCSSELLQASVASGLLGADVQVWAPGLREWTTVGELIELPQAVMSSRSAAGADLPAASLAGPAAAVVDEPVFGEEPPEVEADPFTGAALEQRADAHQPLGELILDELEAPPVAGEPHPWRRWFARIIDMTIIAFLLGVVIGIAAPDSAVVDSSLTTSILVLLVWMVAEPFVLTHFENTPGKALLNIRLRTAEGRSLRLAQAFQRSARVWFFGLGAGLPIVSLVTMAIAYNKLNREGITSWDRDGNLSVTHGPIGVGRMVAIGLFLGFYVLVNLVAALA